MRYVVSVPYILLRTSHRLNRSYHVVRHLRALDLERPQHLTFPLDRSRPPGRHDRHHKKASAHLRCGTRKHCRLSIPCVTPHPRCCALVFRTDPVSLSLLRIGSLDNLVSSHRPCYINPARSLVKRASGVPNHSCRQLRPSFPLFFSIFRTRIWATSV